MAKMSDDEFVSLVKRRRDDALAHLTDNLASDRRKAMQYYRGDNLSEYGNSGDGLSTLVSRDMMEAVESIIPALVKPFIAGDETVRFEPTGPEDEEPAKQATEYINYLFQNHNDAVRVIYDFTKDGLMFRLGVAKVVFEEVDDKKLETYQGLGPVELKALETSDDHEIVGDIMQAEDGSFEVKCSRSVKRPTFRVDVIAPDEFLFEARLANMDEGRFFGHRATKPIGDFVAMGLPKDKVMALRKDGESEDDDDRFKGENERDDNRQDDDLARLVTIDECYIRCDRDNTGALGWRKVFIGANDDTILLDEEADDHPYETWTPIPLPHKLVGMSVYDLVKDLQQHGTAVLREMSNAMYLSNRPQREVVEGQVNFEDLLNPEVGGLVRVKATGMIREIASGGDKVMQQSMAMMEQIATQREQRTGSTRYNQGMDANSLNKTATGISIIQNASQQRQELVARHLAEGIKGVFKKMLGLVCRHLDKKEVIRLRGKWVEMDVTAWKDSYDMSVAVGLGTAGAFLLTLATVTTHVVNIYMSSLAWKSLWPRTTDRQAIWSIGIIGTLLSAVPGIWLERYTGFMTILGAVLVPVGGVLIAHFYLCGGLPAKPPAQEVLIAALYDRSGTLAGVSLKGMIAWAVGAATYFLAGSIGGTLPALAVSVLVYWAMPTGAKPLKSAAAPTGI